jgi:hypothetical protein
MWNDPNVDLLIKRAKRKRIRIELTMKVFNNTNIEKLVTSDDSQKVFISNVLHLLDLKALSGVNLDFEYVGNPAQKVTDGFTRLVTNLKNEMKRQIPGSSLTVDTYINAFRPNPDVLYAAVNVARASKDKLAEEKYSRTLRMEFPDSAQARALKRGS